MTWIEQDRRRGVFRNMIAAARWAESTAMQRLKHKYSVPITDAEALNILRTKGIDDAMSNYGRARARLVGCID